MGIAGRIIGAVISAAVAYALYIYLPAYLLGFLADPSGTFSFGAVSIEIGDFTDLVNYITFLGWIIVGMNFAHGMAPSETPLKAIWRLVKAFLSVTFWGIFLYLEFNLIDVVALLGLSIDLTVGIDITGLFYVMMGGT